MFRNLGNTQIRVGKHMNKIILASMKRQTKLTYMVADYRPARGKI